MTEAEDAAQWLDNKVGRPFTRHEFIDHNDRVWDMATMLSEFAASQIRKPDYDIVVKRTQPTKWDKKGKFIGIMLVVDGTESTVPVAFLRVSEISKLKAMIERLR